MRDLQFCCWYQSWTYCPKCQKLKTRKLQPAFRRKTPSPLHNACKCGIEDVPLILGNLTKVGVCVLRSLEMHWGNTKATSVAIASEQVPSGQYWSKQMVTEKIDMVDDPACHHTLLQVYQFLMQKEDSSYAKFIHMHIYQWLSLPLPIWNLLHSQFPWHRVCSLAIFIPYHSHGRKRAGGTNQLSKQQNILHVQSALSRAVLCLKLWTAVSPVWQVAVQNDSSKASGCSPNRNLGNKSFSRTPTGSTKICISST